MHREFSKSFNNPVRFDERGLFGHQGIARLIFKIERLIFKMTA